MREYLHLTGMVLLTSLACSGTKPGEEDFTLAPGTPPPVTTDSAVYTLARVDGGYSAEAVATYTNTTGRSVYYQRCLPESEEPIHGVRRTGPDSTARTFLGSAWACVGGVPTGRVVPGAALGARVNLGSTDSPDAQPPITPEQRVGRFRVELALCARHADDSGDCDALPQAARESNVFELRLAGP